MRSRIHTVESGWTAEAVGEAVDLLTPLKATPDVAGLVDGSDPVPLDLAHTVLPARLNSLSNHAELSCVSRTSLDIRLC